MNPSNDERELLAEHAAAIVGQLDAKLGEVATALHETLVRDFAEMAGNGELVDLLRDAVEGNLNAYIPIVRHRIPIESVHPPASALEHARRMAQRGVPANTLVRGYRLAHRALLELIVDEINEAGLEAQVGLGVFQLLSSASFSYIDRVMEELLASHQRERDRWLTNKNRLRAVRVQEALNADVVDLDELTTSIGYSFGRTHLAMVVWFDDADSADELMRLEQFTRELGRSIDPSGRPLFVAADGLTAWAWFALNDDGDTAVAKAREFVGGRAEAAPRVVVGDPGPGISGFRSSHRQALDARAAMIAACRPVAAFTSASDPGVQIAVRFREDLDATRAWVYAMLGGLATDGDGDERLRETLRLFLQHGSSFKATADLQHLHVNTVKYRVARAIERRGRELGDDRLDVEVALSLADWYGGAVLA